MEGITAWSTAQHFTLLWTSLRHTNQGCLHLERRLAGREALASWGERGSGSGPGWALQAAQEDFSPHSCIMLDRTSPAH